MNPAEHRVENRGELLENRLRAGSPLVLDGAMGTELERRGLHAGLPLWSTHALLDSPESILEIHLDSLRAGSEILTANTFRTQRRTLERACPDGEELGRRDAELTSQAVGLARRALHESARPGWIAGSAPSLEDCYRPDLVPEAAILRQEHERHARNLVEAGVDLILIETMNTIREAATACEVAREFDMPAFVSFVVGRDARLLSGESLADAARAVRRVDANAILVNCSPPTAVADCLPVLAKARLPFGVYPNLGQPTRDGAFVSSEECGPDEFGKLAVRWIEAGARIVGGCCGTTPEHIRAVSKKLGPR